ncbi:uncharacterized protein [Physcomitrium patens]|uniref:High mobility group box 1 n=1 Tax=Physcomitrium patens TaxID=3218 RepID=A9Q9K8_PHYPA|nr:high mobility group B protein 7-like isoform X1 [Physcomitrium patens]ABV48883.1 high mobility group protein B1 [Physcomitrium patens]PNR42807.1 hypothetical protein PHYPA_017638 [Physcomitrium patens]|eukprot:XP_024393378.1 high mobility group B protein 7-like isoform X1 [Physcomitrella patens]
MAAAAMSSVVRVASCTGSTQDKRILHSLMALHAAKIFVAVESSSRGAVASAALKTKTSLVREEECSVGAFCSLYSTFSEVSTRGLSRVAARSSAAATNGAVSLNGDASSGGAAKERSPKKHKKSETKKKAAKDSDMPKRPPSAYFIFMETFRKEFKAANPDVKGVTASAKAGGEKWLSMSEEEKAPYVAEASVRKGQYEQAMTAYKNGKALESSL